VKAVIAGLIETNCHAYKPQLERGHG
jgi:hypothetical protein